MIISMHRFFKKNAKEGIGILLVVVLVIGLVGIPAAFQKTASDIWVIRVNDQTIDYKSYIREVLQYRDLIASVKSAYGQFANYLLHSMGLGGDPEQIAVEKLINQALLDQLSSQTGVVISPDYVMQKIKDPVFMKNFFSHSVIRSDGSIDQAMMKKELAQQGLSIAEFEALFLKTLSRKFFLQLSEQTLYVPQFDKSYVYRTRHAVRDLVVFELPFEFFFNKAQKETIDESEAKAYFSIRNRSSRQYWSAEMRDGIVYRFARSSYEVTISDQEMQQYYQAHKIKQYVKDPAIITVEKITDVEVQKLLPDKSLAEIAFHISDYDNLWATVEPFSRGTHEESFERAAFALKNPGDISGIVSLSDGTSVILKLVSLQPRTYKPFDSVKSTIKKELELISFKKQFVRNMDDAIKTGSIREALAKSDVQKTMLKSASSEDSALGIAQLFSIKKEDGYQVFVENDFGYVVHLEHIVPAQEQDFAVVRDMVYKDMHRERATKDLKKVAASIGSTLASEGLQGMLKAYEGKIVFEGDVNPSDAAEMKKVEKFGLYSDLLSTLDQKEMIYLLKMDLSALFVYIRNIDFQKSEEASGQKIEEISKFSQERASEQVAALVASFYRDATIDVNTLVLDTVPEDLL
jgi:hypothetical protein